MKTKRNQRFYLRPIGIIRSSIKEHSKAPKQGSEGAPDAWLEVQPWASAGLRGVAVGDQILVVTWLHQGRRDVFEVYPRKDRSRGLWGVFATRSPDRPNPLGIHPVTVREVVGESLKDRADGGYRRHARRGHQTGDLSLGLRTLLYGLIELIDD